MIWNHRVIFHREKPARNSYFAVHECHYDEPGDTIPHSWTESPITIVEDNVEDIRVTATRIRHAALKPTLEIKKNKLVVYSQANRSSVK